MNNCITMSKPNNQTTNNHRARYNPKDYKSVNVTLKNNSIEQSLGIVEIKTHKATLQPIKANLVQYAPISVAAEAIRTKKTPLAVQRSAKKKGAKVVYGKEQSCNMETFEAPKPAVARHLEQAAIVEVPRPQLPNKALIMVAPIIAFTAPCTIDTTYNAIFIDTNSYPLKVKYYPESYCNDRLSMIENGQVSTYFKATESRNISKFPDIWMKFPKISIIDWQVINCPEEMIIIPYHLSKIIPINVDSINRVYHPNVCSLCLNFTKQAYKVPGMCYSHTTKHLRIAEATKFYRCCKSCYLTFKVEYDHYGILANIWEAYDMAGIKEDTHPDKFTLSYYSHNQKIFIAFVKVIEAPYDRYIADIKYNFTQ
jgi:hypothetical protein